MKLHITRVHHKNLGWCWGLYTSRGGKLLGASQSFVAICTNAYLMWNHF